MTLTNHLLPARSFLDVGFIRRQAAKLADGLSPAQQGRIGVVVTELATNLVKHAGGGSIALASTALTPGLHVVSYDRGPGFSYASLRDGQSTTSTAGTGLGAVRRMSDALVMRRRASGGMMVSATIGGDKRAAKLSIGTSPAKAWMREHDGVVWAGHTQRMPSVATLDAQPTEWAERLQGSVLRFDMHRGRVDGHLEPGTKLVHVGSNAAELIEGTAELRANPTDVVGLSWGNLTPRLRELHTGGWGSPQAVAALAVAEPTQECMGILTLCARG